MSFLIPKKTMVAENVNFGVCLWRLPDGSYIVNPNNDYLCMQGRVGDKLIETKMRYTANELGFEEGKPWWLPGFRQISENEYCDQMERLQEGKVPDPAEIYLRLKDGNRND